jgi:superoxide dismutase, Fe-Mn family
MAFELPPLPYAFDALEPYIDARTMEIHHDRHHAAYVNNLNAAIKGTDLDSSSVEEICGHLSAVPEAVRTTVRNNGGGHWNHTFFWQIMASKAGGQSFGAVADAITATFGDFAKFKEAFTKAAVTRFGSGWAWLVVNRGKLEVFSTPNQDNPLMDNSGVPILGLDVWEHAYYLKYQNKRPDYIEAWWNVVNWAEVQKRFAKVK